MLSVLGQVLPEAIGIALSPFPIIGLILMLLSKNARKNSLMFMLGWLAGLTIVANRCAGARERGKNCCRREHNTNRRVVGKIVVGHCAAVSRVSELEEASKGGRTGRDAQMDDDD